MDRDDPLWIPSDGEILDPQGSIRPQWGRKWSPEMAEQVIEIVGDCGSPMIAAKRLGISPETIKYWRRKDQEFRARYDDAIRSAVENMITTSIARAQDVADPSNEAFTLAWLRLRGDRVNAWLDGETASTDGMGLDHRVVALMTPDDRRTLLNLLNKYMEIQNGRSLPKP